jgi:hypothetical protein
VKEKKKRVEGVETILYVDTSFEAGASISFIVAAFQ